MPLLNFDPQVGMVAPDTAVLRDAVAANWEQAFNTGDGSPVLDTEAATPAGQLVDAEAAYLAQANAEFLYIASMLNPRTSEGVWQDALGYIYFLTRKVAQPTLVTVTCTGLQNTVIPAGAQMQDDDGVRYECQQETTIPAGGSVDVPFQCLEAGPIECPAGTLSQIVTVIPGWDTGVNAAAGVVGRNRESQADFENRRFASVAKNSHGSVFSLQGALADLDGVVDCTVLENPTDSSVTKNSVTIPAHSVAICIYGGADADIAETIYMKKDAGCGTTGGTTVSYTATDFGNATYSYEIVRPTPTDVHIEVEINKTDQTSATVEQDIIDAVIGDFLGNDTNSGNTRVGLAQTVYASRFSVAVIKTAGVQDLVGITIGLGSGSMGAGIDIPGDVEPTISSADITVTINEP
jgi:uncharacterized phage protein gp47/JayE